MWHFRVLRSGFESRYGRKPLGDHCAIPWLVRHAAAVIGRYQVGTDGKTAHRRLRGRDFRREVADFWGMCNVSEARNGGKRQGGKQVGRRDLVRSKG